MSMLTVRLMKFKVLFLGILFILLAGRLFSQSSSYNYVRVDSILISGITSESQITSLSNTQVQKTFTYLDGIGRPLQSLLVSKSPSSRNIVQIHLYDSRGNETTHYLPFTKADNSGSYISDALTELSNFYKSPPLNSQATNIPYAQTVFESSPLNRVLVQSSPGESWSLGSGHTTENEYRPNSASEVKHWVSSTSGIPSFDQNYPAGGLFTTMHTDENNHQVITYEDLQKKIVQKRYCVPDNGGASTSGSTGLGGLGTGTDNNTVSYVYNDFDLLSNVIPPNVNASKGLLSDPYNYYTYVYNAHKKLIQKQIPAQAPIVYVYDTLDRVVLEQDGNLADTNCWRYKKYDRFNRVIMEGIYHISQHRSQSQMQSQLNGDYQNGTYQVNEDPSSSDYIHNQGYTNQAFPPNGSCLIQKVYYYDTYDFHRNGSEKSQFFVQGFSASLDTVKTKLTCLKARLMNDTAVWRQIVYFYDSRYRIIQQDEKYEKRKITFNTISQYLFTGVPCSKTVMYSDDSLHNNLRYTYSYSYDADFRLISTKLAIQNIQDTIEIEHNGYNELGQLIGQGNHYSNDVYLCSRSYSYNIRSWLTSMNVTGYGPTQLLKFNLYYDQQPQTANSANFTAQYNGNISSQTWVDAASDTLNEYDFTYDPLNRLINSNYTLTPISNGGGGGGGIGISTDKPYQPPFMGVVKGVGSEGGITYDQNGNILTLTRKFRNTTTPEVLMDKLTYAYGGSRLIAVDDTVRLRTTINDFNDNGWYALRDTNASVIEFQYDMNGNMTKDYNRNIDIAYNSLNLPEYIYNDNGVIKYDYDQTGTLYEKQVTYNNSILLLNHDYRYYGDIVVDNDTIRQLYVPDGCVQFLNSGHEFNYHIKDHLGNVRMVVRPTEQNSPEILQRNDYYPLGMVVSSNLDLNKKLYNDKELQTEMKYAFYNYGARFYDPQLGRWHSVDPLAETSRRWTPYNYGLDNPIRFIDPDGMFAGDFITQNGRTIGTDGKIDDNVHLVTNNKDIKKIKDNDKSGKSTDPSSIKVDVTTTKTVLKESINVLDRTIKNGGLAEETSVVTPGGEIVRGNTGQQPNGEVAQAKLPAVEGENNTSIHSHPTETTTTSGFNALKPGPADPKTFQHYELNVIVGPLGDPKVDQAGNDIPRINGAVFFDRNTNKLGSLTRRAIEKVLNK